MAKKKLKKDAKEENLDEIVDSMYEDEGEIGMIERPHSRRGSFALYALAVAIISLLGGIVGELVINNYLYYQGYDATRLVERQNEETGDEQVIVFKKEEITEANNQTKTLLENIEQVVVGIYLKRGGDELVDQVYRPEDKVGNALVLTSDGWLATTVTGMPDEPNKELVIITESNTLLPIERVVLDPVSDIVFLKVTAENLKVIKFADEGDVYPGLPAVLIGQTILGPSSQSVITAVEHQYYRPADGFADTFLSTEKYATFIKVQEDIDAAFDGSPLIDMEGAIIGLYYTDGKVIPAQNFMDVFERFLRSGEIERPYVGFRYIDLAHTIGLPTLLSEDLQVGALVFGDREHAVTAIDSDSPAADAGLSVGDIVLKVNDDDVDARHSVTSLLQEYRIGDVVQLTVQNSGEIREVDLLLTSSVLDE
ncbi:MAG: S1C family serine protease [Patescibacteria group bacterium]